MRRSPCKGWPTDLHRRIIGCCHPLRRSSAFNSVEGCLCGGTVRCNCLDEAESPASSRLRGGSCRMPKHGPSSSGFPPSAATSSSVSLWPNLPIARSRLIKSCQEIRSIESELQDHDPLQAAERVQSWLLERVAKRVREVDPELVASLRLINATGGRARIAALAKKIGKCRRRLERLFGLQVGVGPKEFASVVGFDRTVRRVGGFSGADMAFEAGYAY